MSSTEQFPTETSAWVITSHSSAPDGNFSSLQLQQVPVAPIGDHDVLVKIKAVSLNYRDLVMPIGQYPSFRGQTTDPIVAGSDCSGEVIAIGKNVSRFQKGDRIATIFNNKHLYGSLDIASEKSGLGGSVDGTLREYATFNEETLVKLPENLSWEEGGSLTCAGVTAWNALYGNRPLKAGDWVLVQGTGGVSTFALKFAKAAGAKVIATTSSESKADFLRSIGADHVINYKTQPEWGAEARKLTPSQRGVDYIIETGGPATVKQSYKAIAFDGIISLIGAVAGKAEEEPPFVEIMARICIVRGIFVGSRQQFEDMNGAIEANDIKPVIDKKVFGFKEAKEAYKYQWEQKHLGNVVIKTD